MFKRSFLLISFMLVLVLDACTAEPTPTSESKPRSSVPAGSNYHSAEGGFYLTLPDGWHEFGPVLNQINPDKPYLVFYFSPNPIIPDGGINFSQIILADKDQWTPETLVKAQCLSCPTHPFEDVTLGNKPAQRTQIGGGDLPFLVTWYFFEHNRNLVGMTFLDPDTMDPLVDVVESIYFP